MTDCSPPPPRLLRATVRFDASYMPESDCPSWLANANRLAERELLVALESFPWSAISATGVLRSAGVVAS